MRVLGAIWYFFAFAFVLLAIAQCLSCGGDAREFEVGPFHVEVGPNVEADDDILEAQFRHLMGSARRYSFVAEHVRAANFFNKFGGTVKLKRNEIDCSDFTDKKCAGRTDGGTSQVQVTHTECLASTAVLHEIAHQMLDWLFNDPDSEHRRDEIWRTSGMVWQTNIEAAETGCTPDWAYNTLEVK